MSSTTMPSDVAVTVAYTFETIVKWKGIVGPWEIRRTVEMPILP